MQQKQSAMRPVRCQHVDRTAKEGCTIEAADLLRRLQRQNTKALEQAVAQYGAYVMAIIRNRSRGVLTAEDQEEIASNVFLSLWRGAKGITRGQLRPWLGAVARNRTTDVCGESRWLFLWKTTRRSCWGSFGSGCTKRSAVRRSKRRFWRCQMKTGKSFIGFTIWRRQQRRSQKTCT